MNRIQALTIFNIDQQFNPDELQEALEELLFQWKKELLMRDYSVEWLFIKRKRLLELSTAYRELGGKAIVSETIVLFDHFTSKALSFSFLFDRYERQVSQFKLELSKAITFESIIKILDEMISFQNSWESYFLNRCKAYFSAYPINPNEKEKIKISAGTPIQELRRAHLKLKNNPELVAELKTIDDETKAAVFTYNKEASRIEKALKRRDNE